MALMAWKAMLPSGHIGPQISWRPCHSSGRQTWDVMEARSSSDISLYGGVVCAVKLVDHEVLSSNPAAVQIYRYYPSQRLNLIFFNVNQSAFYFIYVSWHLHCLSPHCQAQPTYKGMHSVKNVDKQETAVFNVLPHINVLGPVYPTSMYKLWAECRWS